MQDWQEKAKSKARSMIIVLSVAFVDDAGICAIAILEAEGVLAHARQNVARLDLSTTKSCRQRLAGHPLLPFALEKEGLSRFHGARRPVTMPFASQGPSRRSISRDRASRRASSACVTLTSLL